VSDCELSICVPTYSRAGMLKELIASFGVLSRKSVELLILDDASKDDTKKVCELAAAKDSRIRYVRNPENLGFYRNLRECIVKAEGDIILLLGDDDILLSDHTDEIVIRAMDRYSDADYAYPNSIQVTDNLGFSYGYRYFARDTTFAAGSDSYRNTWLYSIFISGICLRRSAHPEQFYPPRPMLFPQVEMVGRMLAKRGSVGLSSFLIGARAHEDQLGFNANKGRRILGPERHGNLEILEMARRLSPQIPGFPSEQEAAHMIVRRGYTNLPNEKIYGDTSIVIHNYRALAKLVPVYQEPQFWASLLLTLLLPRAMLRRLRDAGKVFMRTGQEQLMELYDVCARQRNAVYSDLWPKSPD